MTLQMTGIHFPLRGLKVVEWGDFVAVPYAARLFADAGAEVVKVEPPEGDSARREGPFPEDRPDPECSGLFAYLNRGKRSVVLDLRAAEDVQRLRRLVEVADVFVHDQLDLAASALGTSEDALRAANPRLIVVSVTPFGRHGPHSGRQADELILAAAGGLIVGTPGIPDWSHNPEVEPPLRSNAHIGELVSGVQAAIGAMFALLNRHRSGEGDAVEISKQEALAALMVRNMHMWSYGRTLLTRYPEQRGLSPNHYMPVADGWAVIVALTEPHWRSFVEMMGSPSWAEDPRFATAQLRDANWEVLEPLLGGWLRQQSGQWLAEETQRRGIPCAVSLTIQEAVENPHVASRHWLVPSGLPGDDRGRLPGDLYVIDGERRPTTTRVPTLGADTKAVLAEWLGEKAGVQGAARPLAGFGVSPSLSVPSGGPGGCRPLAGFGVSPNPSSSPPQAIAARAAGGGDTSGLPLAGVRVIDLGQYLAMPYVGQMLGFLGAEVLVVESNAYLNTRRFPPFAGEGGINRCGGFNFNNRNKKSCTVNLRTPEGIALIKRLVATGDIVQHNFSPGTMEKLGLGYEDLRAVKPDVIMLSLSACGSTGPWGKYAALHSAIQAWSGIASVTGYEGGHPRMIGAVIPDYIAAICCLLGALQAVYHRKLTGQGQHLEVAMTEGLQSLIPEAILEYTMLGREAVRIGNRHRWKAPHGLYRGAGDDRWLALSVAGDAQWRGLCRAMGRPDLASDQRFADLPARRSNAAALDEAIAEWSRTLAPEEAARRLQEAGVPASLVYDGRDLLSDAHLRERGFILEDLHPLVDPRPIYGVPWHFQGFKPEYRHAPILGADNEYVFGEILGLAAEEISRLEAARVIY